MFKCTHCEREFEERKSLDQHVGAKHTQNSNVPDNVLRRKKLKELRKAERASHSSATSRNKTLKYGVGFLAFVIIVYSVYTFSIQSEPSLNGDVVRSLPSGPIHWHPTLTIKINGEKQIIPAEVGIGPTFHSPIHTHAEDNFQGVLHMENNNPTQKNTKLGLFFDVWGKAFNQDCIFEYCSDGEKSVKMFVNGEPNFDFGNYVIGEHDRIEIEYS